MYSLFKTSLVLLIISGISSCQASQSTAPATSQSREAVTTPLPRGAATAAAARAALAAYLQQQPNAAVYLLDSARVTEVDTSWQVLVPRTDWATRMPNAAAFEVDKKTGTVTVLRVK
jgi:hypothetical protein